MSFCAERLKRLLTLLNHMKENLIPTSYFNNTYVHELSTAAINVTKVTVDISPSDDDVIPVVLELQDDSIVEPTDFYQLVIVNISDPNVLVGEVNTTIIIVNDDDDIGKIWHA